MTHPAPINTTTSDPDQSNSVEVSENSRLPPA